MLLRKSRSMLISRVALLSACAVTALTAAAAAPNETSEASDPDQIDLITVVGKRDIKDVPGSVAFISQEDLELYQYTDIHRILRQVPGLNVQEEDGFGLRPNIGLRGSGTDRSSKVVLMEDGVLMAPAPYAAPSAYYFPNTTRMNAVEVTKGPSTVKYGPNTTAGAIHFFSTPIPEEADGYLSAWISDLGHSTFHAWAGNRFSPDSLPFDVGFLLETVQDNADGFKYLPDGDTGYDIEDYVAKIGFYSRDGATPQSLELKYQHYDQVSDETYLGLSPEDFERSPYARYNASQNDIFVGDHQTYQATHNIQFSDNIELTTIAYRTDFARNWQKMDRFDNSALSGLSQCSSLDGILRDTTTCYQEYVVLVGPDGYTSPDDVLGYLHNNREYQATGFQTALGVTFDTGFVAHALTISGRYHTDEEGRFQKQDQFRMDNGTLVLTTEREPGTQTNRLAEAAAYSFYVEDQMSFGKLDVTAGLRVETVESQETRWSGPARTDDTVSRFRENEYTEALPSLAVLYRATDTVSLLAGVHRGFAAAGVGSSKDTDPEESIIYEAGGRFDNGQFQFEAIGFFNDYSNLIGACTNSTGSSECDIGDSFNAGEVDVTGLEITATTDLAQWAPSAPVALPVSLAYTYTDSEIKSSFDSDFFGDVMAGDRLPYVPEHQWTLSGGIVRNDMRMDVVINHIGETSNAPGDTPFAADEVMNERTLVDLSASWTLKDGLTVHVKAENLFDEDYLASRQPYGLRPGKPRELFAGISVDF